MRSNPVLLASFLVVAITGGAVAAQPAEGPPARVGFELGGGLQGGKIYCESEGSFCQSFTEAGGANLHGSYFFNPSFGITLDLWAMAHTESDFSFIHYINTVGIKWRPAPILTLQAGIGSAHASLDYNGFIAARATSDDGFAVMGAAALDLIRSRRWALALEARFGNGFYGDDANNDGRADIVGRNVGVGVGFTMFGF